MPEKKNKKMQNTAIRLQTKSAFTLIEVLVVIVVLAVLFAVLLSSVDFSKNSEREATAHAELLEMEKAVILVGSESEGFSPDLNALATNLNNTLTGNANFSVVDSRLESDNKDPWGNAYRIEMTIPSNSNGQLKVYSAGVDQVYATEDDIVVFIKYDTSNGDGKIMISTNGTYYEPYENPINRDEVIDLNNPSWGEDKKIDLEDYTWGEIVSIIQDGDPEDHLKLGDTKRIDFNDDLDGDGADDYLIVQVAGFNHDDLASGSGKASVTFTTCETSLRVVWNSSGVSDDGYVSSDIRTFLNGTLYSAMPGEIKSAIARVNKVSDSGSPSYTLTTTSDYIWLLSNEEVGYGPGYTDLDMYKELSYRMTPGQGTVYDFYANGGSRVVICDESNYYWALRTTMTETNEAGFASVAGTLGGFTIKHDSAIAPGFCIGTGSVALPEIGITLEDATWEQIAAISEAGLGDTYFDVGDTKVVNTNLTVHIVGFDHDDLADGSGKAGITFVAKTSNYSHIMNPSGGTDYPNGSSIGGWAECEMREYCNGELYSSLPIELQAVIKTVNKISDDGYHSSWYDVVFETTQDKVWIPSATEVGITGDSINVCGTLYEYYLDDDSLESYELRVVNLDEDAGYVTGDDWWCRSSVLGNATADGRTFHSIGNNGAYNIVSSITANTACVVTVGFCV